MNEWIIITFTVLYAIIGFFGLIDVWFDFKLSAGIRKFLGLENE